MNQNSRQRRQMRLGVFVQTPGHHVAGWRHPDAVSGGPNLGLMQHIAATAERGKFDMFFLGDGFATGYGEHPSTIGKFEPISLLSALAMGTSRLGLAATASTTYAEPYHVASSFASLDHLSGGRAAWNVVTTAYAKSGAVFGRQHPPHAERYAMAEEFVEACRLLWDSWDDDAFIADKQAGRFVRPGSLQVPDFKGKYFTVEGGLNVPRPPQGHPVLIQAGSSGPGRALATRIADVVFSAQNDLAEAQAFYAGLKAQVAESGRRAGRRADHARRLSGDRAHRAGGAGDLRHAEREDRHDTGLHGAVRPAGHGHVGLSAGCSGARRCPRPSISRAGRRSCWRWPGANG